MTDVDAIEVALRVAAVLDDLHLDYFLGGSLASSFQGEPRATNDIDFVIALRSEQVASLAAALGEDFDVDVEALEQAARRRASWNLYFLPAVLKVDVFVKGRSAFDESEFSRRRRVELRQGRSLFIKSPEDSVLRKLLWFRAGGEVSTTQWRDVTQVLSTHGARLERDYLTDWAKRLDLSELLERALREAGVT